MTNEPAADAAAKELAKLREMLNAWDPGALVSFGAPEDEYDAERDEIYQALTSRAVGSAEALAVQVAAILTRWFEETFTPEDCSGIASEIWEWWQAR